MSLQTGTRLASTKKPLINPSNLKVIAFELENFKDVAGVSLLLREDIREISNIGMIIDSSDEIVELDEVIRLKEIYKLNFDLEGIKVINEDDKKLGKVSSYNVNIDTFLVEQLLVKKSALKSFNDTGLLIHRKQIIEITDGYIKVKSTKIKQTNQAPIASNYANPFRSSKPAQAE
jgi:sporulation protein YlmC with PRC-barrel domain